MYKRVRQYLFSFFLFLLFILTFRLEAQAASWSTAGDASVYEDGSIMLTERATCQAGGYLKTVPIDTRNGFTVSFDCYLGDQRYGPREGFQLIFVNNPINIGYYADLGYWDYIYNDSSSSKNIKFHGLAFKKMRTVSTVSNSGDDAITLSSANVDLDQYQWYNVKMVYDCSSLKVYLDGQLILTCSEFKPSNLSYVGFTAGTSYHECIQQRIRNVSLSAPDACRINLNANKGTVESSYVYALKNSKGSLPTPKRTGYSFTGWYTKKTGGTKINGTNYNFSSTQTVYAHWKAKSYTVKFKANGGTCKTSSKKVTFNNKYGSLPTPKRTGYTFQGWYLNGKKITKSSTVTKAGTHTLKASWKIKTYKVTFNANKGSVSTKSKQVKYNKKMGTLPVPTRSGYAFAGWYNKSMKSRSTTSTRVKSNVTLYAKWVSTSTKTKITLDANGGKCSKSSVSVKYSGKMSGLPTPTRSGFRFLGWYTKESGGTRVTSSTSVSKLVTITKKLYAHWERGSSGSGSSSSGSSGSNNTSRLECLFCNGSGDCSTCGGDGYRYSFAMDNERLNCYRCNTSGNCTYCGGTGRR